MVLVDYEKLENRLRKALQRQGFRLCKSRRTGGYMILHVSTGVVEAGELGTGSELNLDEVHRFVMEA